MSKTVFIIGGGPGGYVCAIKAAQLGANVHLAEQEHLGGTCLSIGCIPTKALLHAGAFYAEASRGMPGVKLEGLGIDWPAAVDRKNAVVRQLTGGVGGLYCAELDGAQLKNRTLIDAGAASVEFVHEYIYYLKNVRGEYGDETGDLYCYKLGDKKPVKIDGDVACNIKYYPVSMTYSSGDGAQVWYFRNMQSLGESLESCAEMLTWSYGGKEPEKVDDNVLWYCVYSDTMYDIRPDGYVYLRYTGDYDANTSLFDMVYSDGKSTTVLAEGVLG